MNRRTVVVGLCTAATWASARAQPVETSVVKMPRTVRAASGCQWGMTRMPGKNRMRST
jgi:hypothetical protein